MEGGGGPGGGGGGGGGGSTYLPPRRAAIRSPARLLRGVWLKSARRSCKTELHAGCGFDQTHRRPGKKRRPGLCALARSRSRVASRHAHHDAPRLGCAPRGIAAAGSGDRVACGFTHSTRSSPLAHVRCSWTVPTLSHSTHSGAQLRLRQRRPRQHLIVPKDGERSEDRQTTEPGPEQKREPS